MFLKALIQRVTTASVAIDGNIAGEIDHGLLVLLGVERGDDQDKVVRMVRRLTAYRVFSDTAGKMNLSVEDVAGSLLVVSQFTIVADTSKGLRPGFSASAKPEQAKMLYEQFIEEVKKKNIRVESGQFAADMQVALVNDGPVTFMLEI
ncbi:MAG: D-tyrosyl-tRNA(Tyr) deacylase [Oceanicoccus sp.]